MVFISEWADVHLHNKLDIASSIPAIIMLLSSLLSVTVTSKAPIIETLGSHDTADREGFHTYLSLPTDRNAHWTTSLY